MTIDFNSNADKIFNPLIYKLLNAKTRFVINFGGAGSGKSYTQTQREIIAALEKKETILVLRKVGSTLRHSVIDLFLAILGNWGLVDMYSYNKSDYTITFFNGSRILFKGLDDPEKIKSIAGVTRIWIEEASELTIEDFKQLNLRLRGRKNLQMTLTFNPISELHWIKLLFFDSNQYTERTTIIKTTYLDNKFIDEEYVKELNAYKAYDYEYYRVYALGEWGKLDTGAEFYKHFDVLFNVGKAEYNPALPLHLSFDENVNPYVSCTIWQTEGNNLRQIDEITMEPPKNTLQYMLTEIERMYPRHVSGMFVYGDATSRKADAKLEKGHNFYTLVTNGLKAYRPSLRVPLSNPSVMVRGMFINEVFRGKYSDVSITIGENCKKTIEDLRYVKEAADGTKLKEKVKDPRTEVTYEKYGHLSDTMDYFVCYYLSDKYNEFQYGDSTNKRVALKVADAINF